jgi:hypothetical protein
LAGGGADGVAGAGAGAGAAGRALEGLVGGCGNGIWLGWNMCGAVGWMGMDNSIIFVSSYLCS